MYRYLSRTLVRLGLVVSKLRGGWPSLEALWNVSGSIWGCWSDKYLAGLRPRSFRAKENISSLLFKIISMCDSMVQGCLCISVEHVAAGCSLWICFQMAEVLCLCLSWPRFIVSRFFLSDEGVAFLLKMLRLSYFPQ